MIIVAAFLNISKAYVSIWNMGLIDVKFAHLGHPHDQTAQKWLFMSMISASTTNLIIQSFAYLPMQHISTKYGGGSKTGVSKSMSRRPGLLSSRKRSDWNFLGSGFMVPLSIMFQDAVAHIKLEKALWSSKQQGSQVTRCYVSISQIVPSITVKIIYL